MGNINKTPEQTALRKELFRIGIEVTEQQLGKTERIPRIGKPSARLVRNGNKQYKVAIRTTQDGWIGFQRDSEGWNTLTGMDWVVLGFSLGISVLTAIFFGLVPMTATIRSWRAST